VSDERIRPFRFSVQAFEAGSGRQWTDLARRAGQRGQLDQGRHRGEDGWVREGAGDRSGDIELEIAAYFIAISEDPADAVAAMARRFGISPEVLSEHPHALIGSVSQICDALEQRRSELGISYVNVAQRSMELFAPVVDRLAGR